MEDHNMDQKQEMEKLFQEFGITCSELQLDQFFKCYECLIEWNKVMNLTTITEFHDVVIKHFLDSMAIAKFIQLQDQEGKKIRMIDVGTGAGFPGIPLKILCPQIDLVLLDSLNKRLNFLNQVIQNLQLTSVTTVHGRAEDIAHEKSYREQFDLVCSRAVANLSTLTELCIPFAKIDGTFISYKSEKAEQEITEAENAFHKLGCSVEQKIEYTLPDSNFYRTLLLIHKNKRTMDIYPRKAGTPAKQPL